MFLGGEARLLFEDANLFRLMYTFSGVWRNVGFESIIYFAAILGINLKLYESVKLDGANCLKQIRYITIPVIMPPIAIIFILAIGGMLGSSFEK